MAGNHVEATKQQLAKQMGQRDVWKQHPSKQRRVTVRVSLQTNGNSYFGLPHVNTSISGQYCTSNNTIVDHFCISGTIQPTLQKERFADLVRAVVMPDVSSGIG